MDQAKLVEQLCAGFDALREQYQKLHGQQQVLEKKLATARDQYNELAKLCSNERTTTPPLSLSSSPALPKTEVASSAGAVEILERSGDDQSRTAAGKVRTALAAAQSLRQGSSALSATAAHGVKIWSGPSADHLEGGSSMMPSISESPLEQDFTIEGKPSKLGCPFASMANKKLSSHAASVLSRYNSNTNGSVDNNGSAVSNASRVNGKESFSRRRDSRRGSKIDPIKAEICALSDHDAEPTDQQTKDPSERQEPGEVGVCPIRFLDQHSPEEVATYFEKHKHELPRSHEVCVMRYQSNEEQIRQLDAKYGNIVSMIQGLGEKHKGYLPQDPDQGEDDDNDGTSDDRVRRWASSVSVEAADGADENLDGEDRQSHFERPLRDIRVGESPSRPWGISVPAKYLEQAEAASNRPAQINSPPAVDLSQQQPDQNVPAVTKKCPFGHGSGKKDDDVRFKGSIDPPTTNTDPRVKTKSKAESAFRMEDLSSDAKMTFTGPVFIGYSTEDAAKILRESGLSRTYGEGRHYEADQPSKL